MLLNSLEKEPDFVYLLQLMPALYNIKEYAILPKLLSIVGFKSLVDICAYTGGKQIYLPSTDEIRDGIMALQWYYDVHIKQVKSEKDIPDEYIDLYKKIYGELHQT